MPGTGISSGRATSSVLLAAPGRSPHRGPMPTACGLHSCRASTTSRASTHRLRSHGARRHRFRAAPWRLHLRKPGRAGRVRRHVGGELMTLEDYRNRMRAVRSDPACRACTPLFRGSSCGTITRWTTTTPGSCRSMTTRSRSSRSDGRLAIRRTTSTAAAPYLDSAWGADANLPAFRVRQSGEHFHAGYTPVPHGPALR